MNKKFEIINTIQLPAIKFIFLTSIGKDGYVTLNVFNLLGEEVATLVNQQQQKGNYEVRFDAAGLTSGIYFYRISSNGIVLNKKLILTK